MPPRSRAHRAASSEPTSFVVVYDQESVIEVAEIRDKKLQRAVFSVVEMLRVLGPQTIEPHSKKVKGATKLRELRPRGGQSIVRPLYFQRSDREFVILAIGPEAKDDPSGFKAAVERAEKRAAARFGIEV